MSDLFSLATYTCHGIEPRRVLITAEHAGDVHGLDVVGLPEATRRELSVRVASALATVREPPLERVRVTLQTQDGAPMHPDAALDLPVALAILGLLDMVDRSSAREWCAFGELGLKGEVRAVRGLTVRAAPALYVLGPLVDESTALPHVSTTYLGVRSLHHAVNTLNEWRRTAGLDHDLYNARLPELAPEAWRGLVAAVAGRHNVLLVAPPSAATTMLARTMHQLLPTMTRDECVTVEKIHSVAGMSRARLDERPFRAPHHTVSTAGLVGGGTGARPGEVSLAHGGVLLLDELPEFRLQALSTVETALRTGDVRLTRGRHASAVVYPARPALTIATARPCPCGWRGTDRCRCQLGAVDHYLERLEQAARFFPLRVRLPHRNAVDSTYGAGGARRVIETCWQNDPLVRILYGWSRPDVVRTLAAVDYRDHRTPADTELATFLTRPVKEVA